MNPRYEPKVADLGQAGLSGIQQIYREGDRVNLDGIGMMAGEQIAFDFESHLNVNENLQSEVVREAAWVVPVAAEDELEEECGDAELISGDAERDALMRQLRQQTKCIQHSEGASAVATFSTGVAGLDAWLPVGGLRFDAITEWVSDCRGSGAITLALLAAANRLNVESRTNPAKHKEPVSHKNAAESHSGGPLVVVSAGEDFYPPSAFAFGIPSRQILWVKAQKQHDQVWAIDQALRCRSTAAVLALLPRQLDERDARRFQLAAEQGRTPGFFVRPNSARSQPCFADVRFHVGCCKPVIGRSRDARETFQVGLSDDRPNLQKRSHRSQAQSSTQRNRQFLITLERCRGGRVGRRGRFEMNELGELKEVVFGNRETTNRGKTTMHLVSKLANPENSKSRAFRVDFAG